MAAEGHASLANVKFLYDWDFPGAEEEYKRAIALNPNYEVGHHGYSILLATEQRNEESVSEARKAVHADPLSVPANNILGAMLVAANRWDEAFTQSQKALELLSNPTHLAIFYDRIGDYYRQKAMTMDAIAEDMKARTARGATSQEIAEVQRIYARSGRKDVVQLDLKKALNRWDQGHWHIDAYAIAIMYAILGDMDSSFQWIDKCVEPRSTSLIWVDIGDTKWKRIRASLGCGRKMGVHY